ncbi:MAG: hypothetical protein ACI93L_003451 [Cyclobacteriaceae bacterium]|jgi:hypothetical protein
MILLFDNLLKIGLTSFLIFFSSFFLSAQVLTPGIDFYESKLNDTTSLALYTSVSQYNKKFTVLAPITKLSFNSGYARGYNDGPIWKGKGATFETHFGIQVNRGGFSLTVQPAIYFSQNSSFQLAEKRNTNDGAYQFSSGIDWVQRSGNSGFVAFNLGQSELKFVHKKFVTSLSTQNFSLGPSSFNPIIMSNQAAGFPHLRLGFEPVTFKIKDFNLGKIETYLIYGLLSESDNFDQNAKNDTRYFNGLFLGFSPAFAPNIKLGFNRAMYKDTQFFETQDIISPIKILDSGTRGDSINTNDTFDQLASVSLDWSFPEVGFRVYTEFAKNDFTGGLRWTILEPEHSRAYTIGFEKTIELKNKKSLNIIYEHTNLSRNHTYLWRAEPTFYVHHINKQGYTNNGQILGAGIGPGSNSDQLNLLLKTESYSFGLKLQRIEFNKDYFVVNIKDLERHKVEYTFGLFHRFTLQKIEFSTELDFSNNLNQYYILDNDQSNIYFSLAARYKL